MIAGSRSIVGLLCLTAFFYIYSIAFRVLPAQLFTGRIVALAALLAFVIYALQLKGRIALHVDLLAVLALYSLYVGWVAWRTVATGAEDTNLIVNGALLLLQVFPGALLLGRAFARRPLEFRDLIFVLQMIMAVQAVFILLSFLSSEFKELTVNLLHVNEDDVEAFQPFRVRGLTHSTGAKLSGFQAIGILFSAYLLLGARSLREVSYLTVSITVLMGSILLTGRTGFLILPLAAMFVALYVAVRRRLPFAVFGAAVLGPLCIVGGFLGLKYIYLADANSAVSSEVFERLIRWVVKEFARYGQGSAVGSSTVADLLQNHWFAPDAAGTLLFGDPKTWALRRIHSDVGPVRMVFGTGIVGVSLLYAAFVATWIAVLRRARAFADRLLLVSLLVWLVLLELKEPILTDVRFMSLVALLFAFSLHAAKRSQNAVEEVAASMTIPPQAA
jgi:hypothetical protein